MAPEGIGDRGSSWRPRAAGTDKLPSLSGGGSRGGAAPGTGTKGEEDSAFRREFSLTPGNPRDNSQVIQMESQIVNTVFNFPCQITQ